MATKVIVNPKTGKMETVDDYTKIPTKEALARQHKELRDMLDGNVQFHNDPFAAPKEKPIEPDDDEQSIYGIYPL